MSIALPSSLARRFLLWISRDRDSRSAFRANSVVLPAGNFTVRLQQTFLRILIACWTYQFLGTSALGFWFNHIGERSRPHFYQFVFFLFSIPLFEASNLFFKLAYRGNQRRLILLRTRQGTLYGEKLSAELDLCFEKLCGVAQAEGGLREIGKSLDRCKALADRYQIGH